jgi:carboxyl-terminal processing protease
MTIRHFRFLLVFIAGFSFFTSCKKTDTTTAPPLTGQALRDSTVLVSRDLYLWYNQIPSNFAQDLTQPDDIMVALRQYSIEPGFSGPVDRWSFAMKKVDWDNLTAGMSSTNNSNSSGDFGISVFFRAEGDLRVKLVEPNSPAGAQNIHRGWRITKINGSTDITTSNADFIVNNVFYSTSSSFTFIKPDGTSVDMTLNAAHYAMKPVYLDAVYNVNGKNVGYLVLNSFLGDMNTIKSEFQKVFTNFASQGISYLIVDLRYNGGGYVALQETLADYISPSSANGGLMMKETYNDKNSNLNTSTNFKKLGSVNLPKVYFIVTKSTASASELVINNLKPYMDVRLVGPNTTHGKPVGFFPVPVGDWYVFPVSFRSTNKNGEGNYFNGFPVDYTAQDGLDHDWGPGETALQTILTGIGNGTMSRIAGAPIRETSPEVIQSNAKLDAPAFKGMIR